MSEGVPLLRVGGNFPVLYKRRWYMLGTFCCIAFLNNGIFVSFAPIADQLLAYFQVSVFWINALSWVTVVSDCVLAVPSMWIIQKFGCAPTAIVASSVLHVAGCAVRFFGSYSSDRMTYFALLLTGQTLVAIAQPMLNAAPPQVSGDWFGEQERSIATALSSTCGLAGLAGGYALFAFVVGNDIDNLWIGTLVQLCLSVVFLVMALFYRNRPPTPPTVCIPEEEGGTFGRDMKLILSNGSFWLLIFIFSLPFGLFVAVWSTLEEILEPSGLSSLNTLAGTLGCVMIGGGIVGSVGIAHVLDRFRKSAEGRWYRRAVWLTVALTPTAFWALSFCIRYEAGEVPIYIVAVVAGMVSIALLPACIEIGVEMTFPANEANSGGLLLAFSNIVGTVYILVLTFAPSILNSFLAISLASFAAVIALLFFRPRYLRLEAEEKAGTSELALNASK